VIGQSQTRVDVHGKLVGSTRYTADLRYPGMLHGVTVRAPLAHGRLKAIVRDPAFDWSRIVFATADEIPRSRFVHMIADDMPFLAWDEVRYKGEPVAICAAETLELAEAARRAVRVEIEPLPMLLTLDELVERHRGGGAGLEELSRWSFGRGDLPRALAGSEVVLEDCYTTPHQEQAYLETNAVIAVPEAEGRMRVEGSFQCPYYVAPAVAAMLGTDLEHLHVLALPIGGAFGGKEDYPSLLAGHAALLAKLSGRPVRMTLGRAEDIACTTKRHPSWVRIRAGARKDGSLCGVEIEILFDGGAYVTMSPVVLSRGAIHSPGPYAWPAARIEAVAYRTHTPPNGAFRGFGVPQTIFAIESHIDRLARACGIEPHVFRRKNRLRVGSITATSQRLEESVGVLEVMEDTLKASGFERKHRELGVGARAAGSDPERIARGVGMSLYWHGAGFTGAGEARIAAKVALDLASDGRAHVRVSSTEMGQGAHTVLAQIAAEELGLPPGLAVTDPVDTARVPNSGPTVASRTTMIVGSVVASCARAARARLLDAIARESGEPREGLAIEEGEVRSGARLLGSFPELLGRALSAIGEERWIFEGEYRLPPQLQWDEKTHTGDAYAAYAWGCTVVEVEVDLDTFELRVPRLTTSAEIGRAVNPILAKGQIEGGTLQALGYALCEEVGVRTDGALLRDRFQTYILPTTMDAPEIDARLIEIPFRGGPGGAKGLGELPMNGAAPAVANAVEHALGVRIRDLPVTPEKIYRALREGAEPRGGTR
jgi:CO/xanthine dehydrogenase Mo-binding subunit